LLTPCECCVSIVSCSGHIGAAMHVHHCAIADGSEENGGVPPERKVYSYMNMRAKVGFGRTGGHLSGMLMTAIPVGQPSSALQRELVVACFVVHQLMYRSDTTSVSRRRRLKCRGQCLHATSSGTEPGHLDASRRGCIPGPSKFGILSVPSRQILTPRIPQTRGCWSSSIMSEGERGERDHDPPRYRYQAPPPKPPYPTCLSPVDSPPTSWSCPPR